MIIPAVTFYQVVLAVHIMAVVVGFGVTFAYPIMFAIVEKADKRALPALLRAEKAIGQRLISPSLLVILLAGIYLASKLHVWSSFYVQWGFGVAIVLGAMGGLFFTPTEARMIDLAERDVAAAGDGEVVLSPEYLEQSKRLAIGGAFGSGLVLLTIFFMTTQTGA